MKKTYRMMLALVALLLGAVNVSAGERIPLTADNFFSYQGYGLEAVQGNPFQASYIIDQADGCPFGDSSCEARVDLGAYSKLYVKMEGCDADGNLNNSNPRIFINRTENNGQFNVDKAASKCIVIPNDGTWAAEYYTKADDGTYIIDLLKIKKEFGFVHLAAIKGSAYNTKAILHSIEVETLSASQQVGWVLMTKNGDLEGSDESSIFPETHYSIDMSAIGQEEGSYVGFYSKTNDPENPNANNVVPSLAEEGVGVDGSRGIKVTAKAGASQDWDAQFWINGTEDMPAGTKFRVSFDYRASRPVNDIDLQTHGTPSSYILYHIDVNDGHGDYKPSFTTDWQTMSFEGVVPDNNDWTRDSDTDKSKFHSIAFNLCKDRTNDIDFFFDNIKFEIYKYGASATFCGEAIQLDFGFDTNIAELAKKKNSTRVIFPKDCFSVTVNGKLLDNNTEIISFEGFDDGRFFIFPEDILNDEDKVEVIFINPADAEYHLVYTSGNVEGNDVANFAGTAIYDDSMLDSNIPLPSEFDTPMYMSSNPENNSFNLSPTISTFTVTFDNEINCEELVAKLDGEALTVAPVGDNSKLVTLTRTGTGALANGKHVITLDKIYPKVVFDPSMFNTAKITISVGEVKDDPNDQMKPMIPDYFAETVAGTIPVGYKVMFDENNTPDERTSENTYSSGPRMFDFGADGDFTKGLYYRSGYVEYGSTEGYELALEADKKYQITFNTARWKDSGSKTRFEIFDANNKQVLVKMIDNNPNVNGSQNAVKSSTAASIEFIPETSGNYTLKWTSAASETAAYSGMENLLANVKVTYIPSIPGLKEMADLETTLTKAKSSLDANDDVKHHGAAFDALKAAIDKCEAEKNTYTGPAEVYAIIDNLEALTATMDNHKELVDTYYDNAGKLQTLIVDNTGTKFEKMDLFQELKGFRDEYGTVKTQPVIGEDGVEVQEEVYIPNALTDDAELKEANEKITAKLTAAGRMFTEGPSTETHHVGVMVLVDRIRQGVEGLKELGVADDDELVVAGNNAVSDDDNLSDAIKNRLALEFYQKMKNGEAEEFFKAEVDEETLEETPAKYNFTVFVKNPNTYAWSEGAGLKASNPDNCPGWADVEGRDAGLTNGWNGQYPGDIEGLPKDLMITQWHAPNRFEQTITDLPAGIYTVMINSAEWSDEFAVKDDDSEEKIAEKEAAHELNRVYVKTSDTPIYEEGQEDPEEFAASARIDHYGQYVAKHENYLTGVEVRDGQLTIGVNWANVIPAQFMFDAVKIYLTGAIPGFDYAAAYKDMKEIVDEIDAAATAATVKSVEFFDINGVQLPVAKKGVNIVKKTMSDGTIITEKIVK